MVKKVVKEIKEVAGKPVGFLKEFRAFLKEYKIVGLAIGFVMGAATTTLVQSLVNNMIMPVMSPLTKDGTWENATATVGPVTLNTGAFGSALLNFIILAFVVFLFAKYILHEEKVMKK